MSFDPVINKKDYTTFWINGKAWGTFHQTIDDEGNVHRDIQVLYGDLGDIRVENV